MKTAPDGHEIYAFADFVLDVGDRTLNGPSGPVTLAPRSFDLLVALVRRGGRLGTKDELLREVWGDVTVTEASLAQAVSQLRRALGDDADRELVVTVPKAGYRFAATIVRWQEEQEAAPAPPPPPQRSLAAAITGALLVAVFAIATWQLWPGRRTAPSSAVSTSDQQQWDGARAAMAQYHWDEAIRSLETLFGRLPDRIEIGLDLVHAYVAAGQAETAEVVLGRLSQLPPPLDRDPRIDLAQAEVAVALSSYQRAAVAAVAARRSAEAVGDEKLVRQARLWYGDALRRLGQTEPAGQEFEAVREEAERKGDGPALARALLGLAAVARRKGDGAAAIDLQRRARERFQTLGDRRGEIEALRGLGELVALGGDFDEGRRLVEQAVAGSQEIGDVGGEGEGLVQLAVVLNHHGDNEAAIATGEKALPLLRRSGNRRRLLATLSNLALSETDRGRIEQAEEYLDEADPLAVEVGSAENRIFLLRARGYLAEIRGDFAEARVRYSQALETAVAASTDENTAALHYDLAVLAQRVGDAPEVVEHASSAEELSRRGGDLRGALMAGAVRAVGEALDGELDAARRRLVALRAELADPESYSALEGIASCQADVEEIAGNFERSLAFRREALGIVEETGDEALALEERFGLARALAGLGRQREAVELAITVHEEARSRGLASLATRAGELLEKLRPSG